MWYIYNKSNRQRIYFVRSYKLIEVGVFYKELNDLIGLDLPLLKIYRSKGLLSHLIKHKHFTCLRLIEKISDIINSPDYIGINPNEKEGTVELIKIFDQNILIGIKLNADENYYYVSTMYEIQQSKIKRRLHSGRIKSVEKNIIDEND